MKEILITIGFLAIFLFGSYSSYSEMRDKMKEFIGYDHIQLKELKEDCEKQLPRDKFCKISVDVKAE